MEETARPKIQSNEVLVGIHASSVNPKDLETLTKYIEQGVVKPIIDAQYCLNDIGQSYARSRSGRASGKIVINIK